MGWVSPTAIAHHKALAAESRSAQTVKPCSELTSSDFARMPFRQKVLLAEEHPREYERLVADLIGQQSR